MAKSSRYEAARKAYEDEVQRIWRLAGCETRPEPYDISAGFVIDVSAWELLENPTKSKAAEIYEALLDYAEEAGWDVDGGCFHSGDQDNGR